MTAQLLTIDRVSLDRRFRTIEIGAHIGGHPSLLRVRKEEDGSLRVLHSDMITGCYWPIGRCLRVFAQRLPLDNVFLLYPWT